MPELAEVDYYRRQWDPGIGAKVLRVHLHSGKRVFRGTEMALLDKLRGEALSNSESGGKRMLFRFTNDFWLGLHLGMTGKLSVEKVDYIPGKHDHLVFFQKERALVFTDARQFGRVQVYQGKAAPDWWAEMAPPVISRAFTQKVMTDFLMRHRRLPIKAALLLQKGFPGIGNWMADEILWRAGILPARLVNQLKTAEVATLWKEVRFVAREALAKIGKDFGDPPKGWLFHERWGGKRKCPKHKTALRREVVGGRMTAWCPKCQKLTPNKVTE